MIEELKKKLKDCQILYLVAIDNGLDESVIDIDSEDITYLYKNRFIDKIYGENTIKVFNKDAAEQTDLSELDALVDKYQYLFSKENLSIAGKRGDRKVVKNKMLRFIKEYKIKNLDSIIEATKLYLDNTDHRYVMMSDYFIYKVREKTKDSEVSTLSVWLEELTNEETSHNTWSIQV